jgi:tetratricopeptide (TPR) repeat protein
MENLPPSYGGVSMFGTILRRFASLGAFVVLLSTVGLAQTVPIEGSVKLKTPEGAKPVADAVIDVYRIDIKGQWEIKSDKNGRFVRLGMPLVGRYLIVFSAPGAQPLWLNQIRLNPPPPLDIVLEPGDGTRLTYDQVQAQIRQSQGGAPAQPQQQVPAVDKAKAEQAQKEMESKKKEAQELQAAFDVAREHYNQGVQLSQAQNFQGALSEFEQAAAIDHTKHKDFLELAYKSRANMAETHYQIGVALFNNKQRNESKPHFEKAVEAIKQAIEIAGTAATPTISNDVIIYYNIYAKNALLLVEHFGAANLVDPAVVMFTKAESADAANKVKWGIHKADLYRNSGRTDEAVAAYKAVLEADPANIDALYGMGLTLIASSDLNIVQQGANTLADFVAKAPATDRRVPSVKEALEAVKNAYKIEAEKPSAPRRRRP